MGFAKAAMVALSDRRGSVLCSEADESCFSVSKQTGDDAGRRRRSAMRFLTPMGTNCLPENLIRCLRSTRPLERRCPKTVPLQPPRDRHLTGTEVQRKRTGHPPPCKAQKFALAVVTKSRPHHPQFAGMFVSPVRLRVTAARKAKARTQPGLSKRGRIDLLYAAFAVSA